jgi:hypothetical protein
MQSAKHYIIEQAVITADRSAGFTLDISAAIVELNIFENIEIPYLTGIVLINDEFDLLNRISFVGTERLEIKIAQPNNPNTITKKFVVELIERSEKVNDQQEMLMIRIIEEHAYNSDLIRFSKAFTGKPEKIIEKILSDQLKITLANKSVESAQPSLMKVVVPYMTPLQSCEWMRARASTINGSPYFLYSALNEKNLVLSDLDSILSTGTWNGNIDRPFTYSQKNSSFVDETNVERQSFTIESYTYGNTENTLALARQGIFGAQYYFTDLSSGITEQQHFDITNVVEKMNHTGVLAGGKTLAIDVDYVVNNQQINKINSAHIHQIISNGSYPDYSNYYEEGGDAIAKYMLNASNVALRYLLFKNSIQFKVPGFNFLTGTNRSIGKMVEVNIFNSDMTLQTRPGVSMEEMRDKKKSGDYLIYAVRHVFSVGKHDIMVDAVKLTTDRGADGGRYQRGV